MHAKVNVCKKKELTNFRTTMKEESIALDGTLSLTLEQAVEHVAHACDGKEPEGCGQSYSARNRSLRHQHQQHANHGCEQQAEKGQGVGYVLHEALFLMEVVVDFLRDRLRNTINAFEIGDARSGD